MKTFSRLLAVTLATAALAAAGCERREGPAEEAGEAVDDTMDEVGDRVDEATDR
jgi:hypothetical protein